MHCEAFIFDLDGTLVSFRFRAIDAKRAMLSALRKIGIELPIQCLHKPTQYIFDMVMLQSRERKINLPYIEIRKHLCQILDRYELEAFSASRLRPETSVTLEFLKGRGMKLGLVTNDGSNPANYILGKYNISRFFNVIVTRDNVNKMKPNPEGLLKALSVLQVPASKAVFVGDSNIDIIAGKDAGLRVAAIMGGAHSFDELNKSDPHYVVRSLEDIAKLVT